ncbi:MAG: hypothetical protein ABFD97_12125 [Syntrophobacter sp.]
MPRITRIDAPGALRHVICPGLERRVIFVDGTDRDCFPDRLILVSTETSTSCPAGRSSPVIFHLLPQTGPVPVASLMRRPLTGYAMSFKHKHRRHGHWFQNRYKSIFFLSRKGVQVKSDERILGDGDFIDSVPEDARAAMERKYRLRPSGCKVEVRTAPCFETARSAGKHNHDYG